MVWNQPYLRRKLHISLKKRDLVRQLLIINFVTGYSQDRDIGVNQFLLFTVLIVAQFQYQRKNFHYYFLRLKVISLQEQGNHHLQTSKNGLIQHVHVVVSQLREKLTLCHSGLVHHGIS